MELAESLLNKEIYEEVLGTTEGVAADFTKWMTGKVQEMILRFALKNGWQLIHQVHSKYCPKEEITIEQFYALIIYPLIKDGKIKLLPLLNESTDIGLYVIKYVEETKKKGE